MPQIEPYRRPIVGFGFAELEVVKLVHLYNEFCDRYKQRRISLPVITLHKTNSIWKFFCKAADIIKDLGASPRNYLEAQFEAFYSAKWTRFTTLGPMQLTTRQAVDRYKDFYERRLQKWGYGFATPEEEVHLAAEIGNSSYYFNCLWISSGGNWHNRQNLVKSVWNTLYPSWLAIDIDVLDLWLKKDTTVDFTNVNKELDKFEMPWYYKFVLKTKNKADEENEEYWRFKSKAESSVRIEGSGVDTELPANEDIVLETAL